MCLLSQGGRSCLLLGESGTANTATINTFLSKFEKDKWVTKTFGFSSATTPLLFQTFIKSIIEKKILHWVQWVGKKCKFLLMTFQCH
jgi:dynein heavy chain